MQRSINLFCQSLTNSLDFCQFLGTGAFNPLTATKVTQQRSPTLGPDAIDILEDRLVTRLAPPLAVGRDCEPVALIANMLNQVKPGVIRCHLNFTAARQKQGLQARFAARPLGHAHQYDSGNLQCFQNRLSLTQLALTTIDKEDVRQNPLAFLDRV